jgi:hypothetical protein
MRACGDLLGDAPGALAEGLGQYVGCLQAVLYVRCSDYRANLCVA